MIKKASGSEINILTAIQINKKASIFRGLLVACSIIIEQTSFAFLGFVRLGHNRDSGDIVSQIEFWSVFFLRS